MEEETPDIFDEDERERFITDPNFILRQFAHIRELYG
jgi:hypothetical protein